MTGIYKYTNIINGHSYIGQSKDIFNRKKEHLYRAFHQYSGNQEWDKTFYRALRKYGQDNFSFEVLEECPIEKLDEREIYWISYYDSFNNGYNETPGGDGIKNNDGENHPNHRLTEKDVIDIRNRYANHEYKDDVYALYKDKIGNSGFNKVWNGSTWKNVHMDVYTEQNKAFHTMIRNSHPGKSTGTGKQLTVEQIKDIRKRILTESKNSVFQDYKQFFSCKNNFYNICNYKTYPYITI